MRLRAIVMTLLLASVLRQSVDAKDKLISPVRHVIVRCSREHHFSVDAG